jgi:hypothetical protein
MKVAREDKLSKSRATVLTLANRLGVTDTKEIASIVGELLGGERMETEDDARSVIDFFKAANTYWDEHKSSMNGPEVIKKLLQGRKGQAESGEKQTERLRITGEIATLITELGVSEDTIANFLLTRYGTESLEQLTDDEQSQVLSYAQEVKAQQAAQAVPPSPSITASKSAAILPLTAPPIGIMDLRPQLAEIGAIRIGRRVIKTRQRKVDGRTVTETYLIPEKLDHFEVTTNAVDDTGLPLVDQEIMDKIGQKCQELDIYLCYDEPTLNMITMYAHYTKTRRMCSGNGRVASQYNPDTGTYNPINCNPAECPFYIEHKCRPYGRLTVVLIAANRVGGAYVYRTTSWNTIKNILSSMAFLHSKWGTGGILAGIPLKMRMMKRSATPQDLGQRASFWVVNIEFLGSLHDLKQAAIKELSTRRELGIARRSYEEELQMLNAQLDQEAEEGASDIAAEFYPVKGEGAEEGS